MVTNHNKEMFMITVPSVRMEMPTRAGMINMLAILRLVSDELESRDVTDFRGQIPEWVQRLMNALVQRYPVDEATSVYVAHIITVVLGPKPPDVLDTFRQIINLVDDELTRLFFVSK